MATFKPCVQKQRADGFYPVYIRVTHQRKVGFIKTNKVVSKKGVTASKEIKDTVVASPRHLRELVVDDDRHDVNVFFEDR